MTISVDGVVYYRVQNATLAVANITNADSATRLLAQTTLRNVLGTKNLSQILSDREEIAHNMQVGSASIVEKLKSEAKGQWFFENLLLIQIVGSLWPFIFLHRKIFQIWWEGRFFTLAVHELITLVRTFFKNFLQCVFFSRINNNLFV